MSLKHNWGEKYILEQSNVKQLRNQACSPSIVELHLAEGII